MAGQIVAADPHQVAAYNPRFFQGLAGLWSATALSNLFNTNKENLQLAGRTATRTGREIARQYKRARAHYDQYQSKTKMPQRSGYKRRQFMPRSKRRAYTKKRSPRAIVQRRRVKARKYGSLRSARRLRLPIGGYTERKVVKLRDNFSFSINYDQLGGNQCYFFCLSDPTDPQMVGHTTVKTQANAGSAPDIPVGSRYYEAPTNYQKYKHQIVPLTNQHSDQYSAITVIGARMTINITNRMVGTSFANVRQVDNTGVIPDNVKSAAHGKIWYAYRVDHYSAADTPFPDWQLVDHGMKTYQNLKETGKFTMGVVPNSGTGKAQVKKIVINYSARKFWPGPMGLPGGQLAQEFEPVLSLDPGKPAGDSVVVAKSTKYKAVVRFVIGPSADYVKEQMQTAADGNANTVDTERAYCLNNIDVQMQTQYHCSLTGLKPISGLDASGIIIPSVPKIQWAYNSTHTHT